MEAKSLFIMGLVEAIKTCFSKYATFSGRATRSEYWWWALFTAVVSWILFFVFPILVPIAGLAFLLPSLAVLVRRLHDTGREWYNIFWVLLPAVGSIILLVFCLLGSKEDNQFGPNPFKTEAVEA